MSYLVENYLFPPPPPPWLPIAGSDKRFPVRRIFCVGRNYAAHAQEMGFDTIEPPFFFTKPGDAIMRAGQIAGGAHMTYPPLTHDLHHEIEGVVAIGKGGADIDVHAAMTHVWGFGVGIDWTRRDLQIAHREKGRPWDWGKAFDGAAAMSDLVALTDLPENRRAFNKGRIWLDVNGQNRQHGDLNQMIWDAPHVIHFCSQSVRLEAGDLIMTGTPAGVGAVVTGDVIKGGIDTLATLQVTII